IYDPVASLIGPPAYPPGLPLTLAPLVAIGGVHSVLVRLLMPASVLLFVALATWRLARDVEPWQAAIGGAFTAYAIEASLGTIVPLSDPGFAALIWATILVVNAEASWTWRRVAAVTALGFAAMSYRTAGVALVPALFLYASIHRRQLGKLPFAPALAWTTAGTVALLAGLVRIPFTERVARSINNLGDHVDTFARQYRIAFADAQLYPFSTALANDAYHVLASLIALVGIALVFARARRSFLVAFAAAYVLMLFLAPVAEPRYAWPLYPLVAAGLASGLSVVVRRVAARFTPRSQALVVTAPVLALLLIALGRDSRKPAPASLVRHPDAVQLFHWLARLDSASTDTLRVAYVNPRVLTLETRITAMGIVPRTPPGILTALTRHRATHLVGQSQGLGLGANPGRVSCVQRSANRLPELYPASFTLAYENRTFRVYSFRPTPGAPNDPGEPIRWSEC
ncbi:MAG: hypothetical protein AB1762_10000, partial [Gemmatimonadota bacterium]